MNLLTGIFGAKLSKLEGENPEAMFESSIKKQVGRLTALKKATAALAVQRTNIKERLTKAKKTLDEVAGSLDLAVEQAAEGDEKAEKSALLLIQKQDNLTEEITELEHEFLSADRDYKSALDSVKETEQNIRDLTIEKGKALAKLASSNAKIATQEALSGISNDADIAGLENARKMVKERVAEAELNAELNADSLDMKLKELRKNSAPAQTKKRFEEMKAKKAKEKAEKDAEKKRDLEDFQEVVKRTEEVAVPARKR